MAYKAMAGMSGRMITKIVENGFCETWKYRYEMRDVNGTDAIFRCEKSLLGTGREQWARQLVWWGRDEETFCHAYVIIQNGEAKGAVKYECGEPLPASVYRRVSDGWSKILPCSWDVYQEYLRDDLVAVF